MKRRMPTLLIFTLSALPVAALAAQDPSEDRTRVPEEQTGVPQNAPPRGVESQGSSRTSQGVIPEMPAFSMVDKNQSGYVEEDEAAEVKEVDFLSADGNKDGRLSRTEYEAAMKGRGSEKRDGGDSGPANR